MGTESWIESGNRALEASDFDTALHAFIKVTELEPDNPQGWVSKGIALSP